MTDRFRTHALDERSFGAGTGTIIALSLIETPRVIRDAVPGTRCLIVAAAEDDDEDDDVDDDGIGVIGAEAADFGERINNSVDVRRSEDTSVSCKLSDGYLASHSSIIVNVSIEYPSFDSCSTLYCITFFNTHFSGCKLPFGTCRS